MGSIASKGKLVVNPIIVAWLKAIVLHKFPLTVPLQLKM